MPLESLKLSLSLGDSHGLVILLGFPGGRELDLSGSIVKTGADTGSVRLNAGYTPPDSVRTAILQR